MALTMYAKCDRCGLNEPALPGCVNTQGLPDGWVRVQVVGGGAVYDMCRQCEEALAEWVTDSPLPSPSPIPMAPQPLDADEAKRAARQLVRMATPLGRGGQVDPYPEPGASQ